MSEEPSRTVWAIGDLHLSFGTPNKEMDLFGPEWKNHADKIKASWDSSIAADDIVLIPGDISWAMRLEEAMPDLRWIDERPGVKILIKGNHDYWWSTTSKLRQALPKSIRVIHNDAICIDNIAIGGARLWESPDINVSGIIAMKPTSAPYQAKDEEKNREIFQRELGRLEASLRQLPKEAPVKIVMTHYPPIGANLLPTQASALFEQYGVHLVVFGHLHSLRPNLGPLFGTARGVHYSLCSCDYLNFTPICIYR